MKTNTRVYILGIIFLFLLFNCSNKKNSSDDKEEMKKMYDKYIHDIESFKIINNRLSKIKNIDSLNYYISLAEIRFKNIPNVNIQDDFDKIYKTGYFSFQDSQRDYYHSHKECLKNSKTNIKIKKLCLHHLTRHLIRKDSIESIYEIYKKLDKTVKVNLTKNEVEGYKQIGLYLDSLKTPKQKSISKDEFEYQKILNIKPICELFWFASEDCYDYRLLTKKFQKFIKNYPYSKFADDAELFIFEDKICGEGGLQESDSKLLINYYQLILNKYPNTDLAEELNFKIINTTSLHDNLNQNINDQIRSFVKDFPESKYINSIMRLKKHEN